MMMGANTAISVATSAGAGPGSAEGLPGPERSGGFPAALSAATAGKPREAVGDRDPRAAASDPALAAALAALLSVIAPDSVGASAEAGAESGALEGEASNGAMLSRDLLATGAIKPQSDVQPGDALDLQFADLTGEDLASAGIADDLVQQMSLELAAARDAAAPGLRGAMDLRTLTGAEGTTSVHGAQGLAPSTASSAATAAAAAAAAAGQALRTPVGNPRWADELGSRLVMMTTRGQNEGSLTLAPEHLGPLEVRISMQQNTANVWFGAQHAETRAALAEALPRLREMLADAGLSLGQSGVSHEAPRQGADAAPGRMATHGGDADLAPAQSAPQTVRHAVSALLDLYA